MALYETTFIARQDISSQDVEKLTDEFGKIVTDAGGKIVKKEYWGVRTLAYKINKNRKGHYSFMGIEAPGETISELNRRYGLNEDVIRSLTIKVDEIDKNPSAILKQNNSEE